MLGQHLAMPFLRDLVAQVRFLLALPLLVAAEPFIGTRLAEIARQFVEAKVLHEEEVMRFEVAARSVVRLRDSWLAELILLGLAFLPSLVNVLPEQDVGTTSWWEGLTGGSPQPSAAGWWYLLISMPLFRFLMLRWAYRFGLWAILLWKISLLRLRLSAIHPDRAGGLGFLMASPPVFWPVAFALGSVLAATAAYRISHAQARLLPTEVAIGAFIVLATVVPILPLLAFAPKLARVRWHGVIRLGKLGEMYANSFDEKWGRPHTDAADELLGTADIQTLADLGSSFDAARGTRIVPVSIGSVLGLAVSAVAPMVPLLLLFYPAKEILKALLRVFL